MKSPFSGMDPYLECRWGDVHTGMCIGIRAAIQSILPPGLRARAQEDVLLEESDDTRARRRFEAYTAIVEVTTGPLRSATIATVGTIEPILLRQLPVLRRNRWVEILDTTASNHVVTVIEVLSPGNKLSGTLNRKYRNKVNRYIEAGVNVVEIDLLRSSRHRLLITTAAIPEARRAAYYTCVNRTAEPDSWNIYPMQLRDPLPTIPVPCRETDSDVGLMLQPIIDRIYFEGGHDDIDYSVAPEPPLTTADAAWAAGLLVHR